MDDWPFGDLKRGHYGAVLADPPWGFRTYTKKEIVPHRTSAAPYETMSADRLRALPVADLAAKDCALFMWVVDYQLALGISIGAHWGFTFKTIAFVWDKGRIGMGYWTRKEAEVCLLFTRGKPKRISKGVRQAIREKRREHSRKPDCTYVRIEALVAGPYAELFARAQRPGWDVWGNEVEKFAA